MRCQVRIPVWDELAGTRKRNSSGHALFCHPKCYFGSNISQANKNPHQDEQVHNQEDAINPCGRRISALGSNIVEPITIFSLAKLSFNWNALAIFLPALCFQAFDLIFVFRCTLWRTSQWFACKADMLAFQIAAIITCTSHIVAGTDGVIPSSGAITNWVTVWVLSLIHIWRCRRAI